MVVVYRAVSQDIVVAVIADTAVEKTKRLEHFREEVHTVQVGHAIAGPARQGMTGEAMVANLRGLSRVQRALVMERSERAATANHADGCRQTCVDVLGLLEVTIQNAKLFLGDGDVAATTEVVAAALAQPAEHMGGFGMKQQMYRSPWTHNDEAMPTSGSPKVEIHLPVS